MQVSIIHTIKRLSTTQNIPKPSAPTCNCRSKTSCPLNGDCLQSSLVYICKADTPNIIENHPCYIGLTENTFKDQFYKHIDSFKYGSKRNATELSNFEWENKYANTDKDLVRNILAHIPEAKRCLLCSTEKYIIFSKLDLLNSRNKLVTKCCHENKFYLANFKDSITYHFKYY